MSARFWGDVRALAVPVLAYWAINLLSVGIFSLAIVASIGPSPESLIALGIIAGATTFGVVFGQICAFLRLRMWVVLLAGTLTGAGLFALTLATLSLPALGGVIGIVWFFFPFCSLSGWLALQPNGAMFATFTPLMFITAAIIFIAEKTGSVAYWFAGQKWAMWDVFTVPVLFVSVGMVLVFLASREVHRLHLWQNADAPDLIRTKRTGSWLGGITRSVGSVVIIGMLTVALTIGSALLAPYLWRTGPRDGDGEPTEEPQPRPEPTPGQPRPQPRPRPGKGLEEQPIERGPGSPMSPDEMERAARNAGVSVLFLLLFALLALLSILVFGPPLRRTLFLTHLRRPLWPVPPSRHVQQSWWLVEVALGDLEVALEPGDVPAALAQKAVAKLPTALVVDPIVEVAAVADRVAFGLGIAPDDTMRARRQAEMAYEAIWSQLTEMQKIRAIYRWI